MGKIFDLNGKSINRRGFIYTTFKDIGFKMCWDLDNLQPLEKNKNNKKKNNLMFVPRERIASIFQIKKI